MSEGLRLDSSWGLRIFLSHARHKTKNIFPYFSIEFKTHHLSYDSIHKTWRYRHRWSQRYAGHVSSINFVIESQWLSGRAARSRKVWGSIAYGGSEFFSLFHGRDKTKNNFLYFFTELKTHAPSFLFYLYEILCVWVTAIVKYILLSISG